MAQQANQNRYVLKHAVIVDGLTYKDVVVRRPKGRDIVAMDEARAKHASEARASFATIAVLCDVPEEVVLEMDSEDITAISEKVASFFPKLDAAATA